MLTKIAPVEASASRAATRRGRIIATQEAWLGKASAYAKLLPVLYGGSM